MGGRVVTESYGAPPCATSASMNGTSYSIRKAIIEERLYAKKLN